MAACQAIVEVFLELMIGLSFLQTGLRGSDGRICIHLTFNQLTRSQSTVHFIFRQWSLLNDLKYKMSLYFTGTITYGFLFLAFNITELQFEGTKTVCFS